MTGIFDSIIEQITGLDSGDTAILTKALGTGAKSVFGKDSSTASMGNDNSTMAALDRGLLNLGVNNNVSPHAISGAAQSVNADSLEAQWRARLNRFAQIQSDTGVNPKRS